MNDQDLFAQALLDPNIAPPLQIYAGNPAKAELRFNIYRNNVMASLCVALADTFPVFVQLVGLDFFNASARAFIRQQSKRSPLLTWIGTDFADFIAAFEHTASMPWLADVARIEFARLQALHATNTIEMNHDVLQALVQKPLSLPNTGVFFREGLAVLESPFSAYSIWSAHQDHSDLSKVNVSQAEACLIYRNGHRVVTTILTLSQAVFITALLRAKTFGEAQKLALADDPEFQLSSSFLILIQARALSGLRQ